MEKKMHVGITGTRFGMSDRQKEIALYVFKKFRGSYLHQGMCEGSDTEMHDLVKKLDPHMQVKGHPSIDKTHEVHRDCDEYAEPKGYLERNRDIVAESELMIATPHQETEQQQGGTWYTVRQAKKAIKAKQKCKKLYVILPSGNVEFYDFEKLND